MNRFMDTEEHGNRKPLASMSKFNKVLSTAFTVLVLLLLFPTSTKGQVVINEFDNFETGDWIELYSDVDIDISGWSLDDSTSTMETIDPGTIIGPSTDVYFVVEVGNRLNADTDAIKLMDGVSSSPIDEVTYGTYPNVCVPNSGQSAGRIPDGTGEFKRLNNPTKGLQNDASEDPCPSPTPSPTPEPTPAPTPTASPSKTPTPIPTLFKTSTPKPLTTKKPTSSLSTKSSPLNTPLTLGVSDESDASPSPDSRESGVNWIAIVMIIVGMGFVGAAGYLFYRLKGEDSNST